MIDFIKGLFGSAEKIIDELHVSEEEKGKLRNEFAKIQAEMHSKSIDLMKAEASSDHWIVAAWRPLCAILLFSIIMLDAYNVGNAPEQVYSLAEIFLTTYAGSRGLEKISRNFKR